MKAILLALFVVAVTAAPLPDRGSDAVEMIVNGVPDGAALEVGDIVDIKLQEHSDGGVVATDLLHPYTAVGIAEAEAAAVAAAAAAASSSSNEVSVVDNAIARNLHPMPIVIPQIPIVPQPDLDIPEPIVVNPVAEPEQLPVAAPQVNGQVYNDGLVQVQYNGPQEPGVLATLQDWFNVVVNYFNSGSSAPVSVVPVFGQPRQ